MTRLRLLEPSSALARCWHPVAESKDVSEDRPFGATVLDQRVVLFRSAGRVVAASDVCPHRGASLTLGTVENGVLACPYHGHRFEGSGRCVLVPASPDQRIPTKLALRRFEAVERHGLVWICLEPPAIASLPELSTYGREGFQVIHIPAFDWACSAGRQIEAIADVAHFAFVHPVSFATLDPTVTPFRVEVTEAGVIRADFTSRVANTMDREATRDEWRRVYDLTLPFTIQVEITFPGKGTFVIFNACCPVSAGVTRVFPIVCRNFDLDQPASEVIAFQMRVYDEDKRIVESQRPVELPLDPTEEVHVKADLISVEYRRQLRRLGVAAHAGQREETVRPQRRCV